MSAPRQRAGRQGEALRRANERMRNMLDSITDGFMVLDRQWRITYINARAEQMIRPPRAGGDGLPGKNLWREFPTLRGTVLEARYRHAMEREESVGFELYYLPLKRWLDVRAYPSGDGLTSYMQDITQRKATERALRESANRLQVALSAGKLGDWRWDAASGLLTLGRRAAEILDLPGDTPMTWAALRARLREADRAPARRAFLRAFAGRADYAVECRVVRRGGEPRWLAIVGHGDYGDDGARRGMTGMLQDITVRKAAEDTLRQSEEQLRALANAFPQLAWIANGDGAMTWYNERWYQYTGTSAAQMAGGGWHSAYAPECVPQMLRRWRRSLRSGQPFEMEFPIRGADGQFRWFLTRANPVRDGGGRLLRWFGTSTDVDQVKRAQEALRDETNVLELLYSTGSALACTRDLRALLQQVTDAATRISGARFGAFCYNGDGGGALTLHAPAGPDALRFSRCAPPAAAPDDPGPRGEATVRIDDIGRDPRGARLAPPGLALRSYLAVPVVSRSGDVTGGLFFGHPEAGIFTARTERIIGGIAAQAAVAIDNTRLYEATRRAAEERKVLLERERRARAEAERTSQMKDEFLSTLSHELRTPLSAILGWAQVLGRGSRDQADLRRGLHVIERNARAQGQLIDDLLDMSRITSGKVLLDIEDVAPATLVDAAVEALRPSAEARRITLEKCVDGATGAIAGDPGRLQQVIANLLSNALKFTPMDGAVRIALRQIGASVEITVADTGIGIAPEFLAHVFERFRQADASTTRRHGGLGLGLAIVKHLVEQHGGTVSAHSEGAGLGATFTLRLPLAPVQAGPAPEADAGADGESAAEAPPSSGPGARDLSGLKVLVVDDDADARALIKRILNDCQAAVCTAPTAARALQLLLSERPDVLVSDIGMPDIDGFALLTLVRALGPGQGGDLPAIALTAFARPEDRKRALDSGFQGHVTKPVEPSRLIAAVAGLIRAR